MSSMRMFLFSCFHTPFFNLKSRGINYAAAEFLQRRGFPSAKQGIFTLTQAHPFVSCMSPDLPLHILPRPSQSKTSGRYLRRRTPGLQWRYRTGFPPVSILAKAMLWNTKRYLIIILFYHAERYLSIEQRGFSGLLKNCRTKKFEPSFLYNSVDF